MEEQTGGEGRVTVGKETRKETVAKTQPGEAGGWMRGSAEVGEVG